LAVGSIELRDLGKPGVLARLLARLRSLLTALGVLARLVLTLLLPLAVGIVAGDLVVQFLG